ncbi:MAG: hypothetical protein RI947_1427 [Candidatus Parcubacteria bacterium]|jgi:hypothetical protein
MDKRRSLFAVLVGTAVLAAVKLSSHRHSMKKAEPLMVMMLDGTPVGRTRQVWLCHCGEAVTFSSGKSWITFRSSPVPPGL